MKARWRAGFGLHATFVAACVGLVFSGSNRLGAQDSGAFHPATPHLDSLRKHFRLPGAPVRAIVVATFLGAPGSSIGSPGASGAESGDYFTGAGFQERTRYTSRPDGGFGAGLGFGDAEGSVGLEVTATSYSSIRHLFGSIGGVSFKFHHRDPQHLMLYAVGLENAASWGLADGGRSLYGIIGRVFVLREGDNVPFGALSTSLGIGNGRFRSEADVRDHRSAVGVFGGVGLRIISAVAVAADWTGQDLDAGFTFTPLPGRGIVATVGMADLTRTAGNGPRFIMSLGFGSNAHRDQRKFSPEDLNAVFTSK